MSRRNIRYFGNLLILVSLTGILTLVYPYALDEYRFHTQDEIRLGMVDESFAVRIPSLKLVSRVVENVDPWDQDAYQRALENGIAHAKGTMTPDESGSIFLFAHSSDNVWNLSRTNVPFYRLNRMSEGESIVLTYEGVDYEYRVSEMVKVWPDQVDYLLETDEDRLILQTCYPIGTDLMRLLVIAERS